MIGKLEKNVREKLAKIDFLISNILSKQSEDWPVHTMRIYIMTVELFSL